MAYIQAVAGGTRYTGNTYNLTLKRTDLLWILLSLLIEAGWQIKQSGDGLSTYSTSGATALTNKSTTDVASYDGNDGVTYAKIANSCANLRAWFIAAPPSGATYSGQLSIQLVTCDTGAMSLRVKFSAGGFANATSATTVPAATTGGDEVVKLGGGTNASPTGGAISFTDGACRMNFVFDNATATPRGWVGIWNSTSDTQVFGLVWDFVDQLLPTDDTYPYVVGVVAGDFATLLGDSAADTAGNGAATRFGASGTTCVALGELRFTDGDAYADNVGVNSINSKEDTYLAMWARPSALGTHAGIKGTSTMIRHRTAARSFADHLTTTVTREFVQVGRLWLPWAVTGTNCTR